MASRIAWRALVSLAIAGTGYYSATHTIDVPIYREVGRQLLRGDYEIYSAVAHGGFRYAPMTALLFVPLAFVPVWLGAAVIFALKVAALFATVAIVLKLMAIDRSHYGKVCLLAFLTAAGYVIEEFRTGNVHFLSLFLVVMAIYLVERGRTIAPACLLALAIAIKLTLLLFLFYFGLRKRFALCVATVAMLLVLFALPAEFIGVEANNRLMEGFIESASQRPDESRNHSLRGALVRHLTNNTVDAGAFPSVNVLNLSTDVVTVLWYVLSACLLVGLAAGIISAARPRLSAILEYAFLVPAILLLSPHSLRIYFSTLFLPFCVLIGLVVADPTCRYRGFILATLGISFVAGTLMPLVLPSREVALAYAALSPHVLVAVLVCATLGVLRWGGGGQIKPKAARAAAIS